VEPCKQEAVIKRLNEGAEDRGQRLIKMEERQIGVMNDLSHLKARTTSLMDNQSAIEKELIKASGDIRHVRERIDNGLSHTVKELHDASLRQEPMIMHHHKWIGRLEAACVAALYGVGLLGCGVIVWAITQGFKP